MPTYDYRCGRCGRTYDVFHKGRELKDDVVCPACGSHDATRLISAAMVVKGLSSSNQVLPCSEGGDCCGGVCSVN